MNALIAELLADEFKVNPAFNRPDYQEYNKFYETVYVSEGDTLLAGEQVEIYDGKAFWTPYFRCGYLWSSSAQTQVERGNIWRLGTTIRIL